MQSSNLRVVILDEELQRIRDYVTSVPHRATGGLLLGNRYLRNDLELVVITRSTTRVPEERLPDESCANHPVFTIADVGKALEKSSDATFLGRWHAHLDGLNRPTSADFDWARAFLHDTSIAMPFILHPIVVYHGGDVTFHPYVAMRESGSFQKVAWQSASQEEISRIKLDRPPPVTREQEAEVGIFSLNKTRQLFREEGVRVASLPNVLHSEVRDDGSHAILEVEMSLGERRAVVHLTGDPWYPLHPPALRVQVDERARKVSSRIISDWTSMNTLQDVVKDVTEVLERLEQGDSLAPPPTSETDPVRREVAMLQAAGYRVYVTSAEKAGALVTARSGLLDGAAKIYYAILPRDYPAGKPAWAIADEGLALSEVQFETIEERPADFTLLTWFERLVPAAREERAQAVVARKRRPWSILVFVAYLVLFVGAGVGGYRFQTSESHDVTKMWAQAVFHMRQRLGLEPKASSAPASRHPAVVLVTNKPLTAVVMDAGLGTNLSTPETQWALQTSLAPVPFKVVQIDLRSPALDLGRSLKAASNAQAFIVFTYAAGDRQADFVKSLVKSAAPRPVGVVSMSPGGMEDALAEYASFYQPAGGGTGPSAAQYALNQLKASKALVIR